MTQLALFTADDCSIRRQAMSRAQLEQELDLWTRCAFRLGDLVPGKLLDRARECFADLNAFYDAREARDGQ